MNSNRMFTGPRIRATIAGFIVLFPLGCHRGTDEPIDFPTTDSETGQQDPNNQKYDTSEFIVGYGDDVPLDKLKRIAKIRISPDTASVELANSHSIAIRRIGRIVLGIDDATDDERSDATLFLGDMLEWDDSRLLAHRFGEPSRLGPEFYDVVFSLIRAFENTPPAVTSDSNADLKRWRAWWKEKRPELVAEYGGEAAPR